MVMLTAILVGWQDAAPRAAPQEGELEDCYQRLLATPAACEQLEEHGVESSEDLRDLEQADVEALAACLKTVPRKKLLRALGFGT